MIREGWEIVQLGNIATITSSKRIYRKEYVEIGVPFYRSKEIIDQFNNRTVSTELYISFDKYDEIKKKYGVPQLGDILITSVGTLGIPFIVNSINPFYFKDGNLIRIKNRGNQILPKFIYYWLQSFEGRNELNSITIGSSQSAYTIAGFKKIEISLPPLPTQQRIASILSNYDDLIENNTRRIKILEARAQALYRQWFVEYKFPGHEAVEMIDSGTEFGHIPEGWEVVPFSDVVHINPKTKVDVLPVKYVDMAALSEKSMIIDKHTYRDKSSGAKFINGDTLFARITPCLENGKTGFVQFLTNDEVACGSTEFMVFRQKIYSPYMAYLISRDISFRTHAKHSMAGASGRQRVHKDCFKSYDVIKPPQKYIDEFSSLVQPMFDLVHKLNNTNRNLKKQRDTLLPRLVSGEILVD